MREGDFISLSYSANNPITFTIPKLLYQDGGLLDVPGNSTYAFRNSTLNSMFSIWSTDWIHQSLYASGKIFNNELSCHALTELWA